MLKQLFTSTSVNNCLSFPEIVQIEWSEIFFKQEAEH